MVPFLGEQGMSSRFGPGETTVQMVTFDSLLDETIVQTYMKFDVRDSNRKQYEEP